ncbi:hypothetical protein [Leptodesmis sichuanensis]|uniref:hypothetical protein n=1 Tax=Leptodesmis sichuanensis TaxID=2906798 RepID=UPI001F1A6F97|nr:hypothetical protein [Leptodesmis sichuanensis]UIE40160.1 hypothetical protein KIK02_11840 [Leptodesmis sichuanensis A121]
MVQDLSDPNKSAIIKYSGSKVGIPWVKDWLSQQAGLFGHLIGDATTAVDLNSALSTPEAKKEFDPQLVKGAEILEKWKPIKWKREVVS